MSRGDKTGDRFIVEYDDATGKHKFFFVEVTEHTTYADEGKEDVFCGEVLFRGERGFDVKNLKVGEVLDDPFLTFKQSQIVCKVDSTDGIGRLYESSEVMRKQWAHLIECTADLVIREIKDRL